MKSYLVDTNMLILHVAGKVKLNPTPLRVAVSSLSIYELLRFPGMSAHEENQLKQLLGHFFPIPVTDRITKRAALLARTVRRHSFDLLIAATALEYGLTLVTQNAKDFRTIPLLQMQTDFTA